MQLKSAFLLLLLLIVGCTAYQGGGVRFSGYKALKQLPLLAEVEIPQSSTKSLEFCRFTQDKSGEAAGTQPECQQFIASVSLQEGQLSLVALSATGIRLFMLNYDDTAIKTTHWVPLPEYFQGEVIIRDLLITSLREEFREHYYLYDSDAPGKYQLRNEKNITVYKIKVSVAGPHESMVIENLVDNYQINIKGIE